MTTTKDFPATLVTSDDRTWTREDTYRESPGILHHYVRYHDRAGRGAYSRGGRALYSIRMTDIDTATICRPGRKIADVIGPR